MTDKSIASDTDLVRLQSLQQCREEAAQLFEQAKHEVCICSHALEPEIYDTDRFVQNVKNAIIRNYRFRMRILVRDPTQVAKRNNRLYRLALQFTDFIQLKMVDERYRHLAYSYLLIDDRRFLYRQSVYALNSVIGFNHPRETAAYKLDFIRQWSLGVEDAQLRRMYL